MNLKKSVFAGMLLAVFSIATGYSPIRLHFQY